MSDKLPASKHCFVAQSYKEKNVRAILGIQSCLAACVQADGTSCGVFACTVCERLAAGHTTPFQFSQVQVIALQFGKVWCRFWSITENI